jgi:hypothetical protein
MDEIHFLTLSVSAIYDAYSIRVLSISERSKATKMFFISAMIIDFFLFDYYFFLTNSETISS